MSPGSLAELYYTILVCFFFEPCGPSAIQVSFDMPTRQQDFHCRECSWSSSQEPWKLIVTNGCDSDVTAAFNAWPTPASQTMGSPEEHIG